MFPLSPGLFVHITWVPRDFVEKFNPSWGSFWTFSSGCISVSVPPKNTTAKTVSRQHPADAPAIIPIGNLSSLESPLPHHLLIYRITTSTLRCRSRASCTIDTIAIAIAIFAILISSTAAATAIRSRCRLRSSLIDFGLSEPESFLGGVIKGGLLHSYMCKPSK